MIKNKFLLIPFLIFAIAFVIDKILLTEKIQTYYSKTVSEINFFHKPILFQELKEYLQKPDRKKVLVYFGNSRALLFENSYIAEKYPDWVLFNFSVPGGSPDFFLFWLEQFQADNVKPDFVLIDNSIEGYNKRPSIKIDECLVNGLSPGFVFRHFTRYNQTELAGFIAKRLFRTYQYRPKLDTILERMKNNAEVVVAYRAWRKKVMDDLIRERGSASSQTSGNMTSTEEFIIKYAVGDFNSYLTPYEFLETMYDFQKDNYRILKEMQIPHAGIWVRVAPSYFQLIKEKSQIVPGTNDKKTPYEIWYPIFKEFHDKENIPFWNMNEDPEYHCDFFTDASHMASACFPDYTDFIFQRIQNTIQK